MGRAVVYTGHRYFGRGRRHKTVTSSFGVGPAFFKVISITAVAVLMTMYVSKGVSNNQNDATIRSLDEQKSTLTQQLEVYQVEEARNANAEATKSQADAMGLVQTTNEVQINK